MGGHLPFGDEYKITEARRLERMEAKEKVTEARRLERMEAMESTTARGMHDGHLADALSYVFC